MKQERGDDDARNITIDGRNYLRINLLSVSGILLFGASFIWSQIESTRTELDEHIESAERRLDRCANNRQALATELRFEFGEALKGKADISQAADRYTGELAGEINLRLEQSITGVGNRLDQYVLDIRRELDHVHRDLDKHKTQCETKEIIK